MASTILFLRFHGDLARIIPFLNPFRENDVHLKEGLFYRNGMKMIKIAGVPEHFNFPWHLAISEGAFKKDGIDLHWINVPEGTGKICQMFRDSTADMAVILSEGIVKDIAAGNPSKIVQVYVQSPLLWGVHVAADSPYENINDLENKIAAISRFGSGSQLIAYLLAKKRDWKTDRLKFEVVHTVEGAIEALANGRADYFLWEHFTTKPLVDAGVFRRLGDCPTPWPSFVIAVRNELLEKSPEIIAKILANINSFTLDFKQIPDIAKTLATSFNQKIEDIQKWLSLTEWSQKPLTEEELSNVQEQLLELNLLKKIVPYEQIVGNFIRKLQF